MKLSLLKCVNSQLMSSYPLTPFLVLIYLVFLNISGGNYRCQYFLKTFYFQCCNLLVLL